MKQISIRKDELLKKVIENKANHKKIVEEATNTYQKKITEDIQNLLERARNKQPIPAFIQFDPPEDKTQDYCNVIKMLEMEVADVVVLTHQEFECYVMDLWSWTRGFYGQNSKYSSSANDFAAGAGYLNN